MTRRDGTMTRRSLRRWPLMVALTLLLGATLACSDASPPDPAGAPDAAAALETTPASLEYADLFVAALQAATEDLAPPAPADWSLLGDSPRMMEATAAAREMEAAAPAPPDDWNRVVLDLPHLVERLGSEDVEGRTVEALEAGFRRFAEARRWEPRVGASSDEFTCDDVKVPGTSRCRAPMGTVVVYVDRISPIADGEAEVALGIHSGQNAIATGRSTVVMRFRNMDGAWQLTERRVGIL